MSLLRPTPLIVAYIILTALLGGLLAYPLNLINVALELDFAYAKVLTRSVILAAVLLLVPFLRGLDLSVADLGYRNGWRRPLLSGWMIGAALMLPPIGFFFYVEFRVLDARVDMASLDFAGFCLYATVMGLVVGLVEETVFRGLLLQSFARSLNFCAATILTSLLYASVHFIEPATGQVDVTWYSGLWTIAESLAPLGEPSEYWDSFLSLFLLGVGFCLVRQRTGSLWWCIGLHAAFATGIRVMKEITVRDVLNPYVTWVGTYDHFTGELIAVWLMLIGVVVYAAGRVSPRIDTRSP